MAEMKVLRDIKELDGKIGVLTGLKTTAKTNLVSAINENTEQINDCLKKVDASSYGSLFEFATNCPNAIANYNGFNWSDMPTGYTGVWGDIWTITGNNTTVYMKVNDSTTILYRVINLGNWVGVWQEIATTTTIDPLTLPLLNGFQFYPDGQWGNISRSGNNVHVNFLLLANGASANTIMNLPFLPKKSEIKNLNIGGNSFLQFRVYSDGRFVLDSGILPSGSGLVLIDFNYTCM